MTTRTLQLYRTRRPVAVAVLALASLTIVGAIALMPPRSRERAGPREDRRDSRPAASASRVSALEPGAPAPVADPRAAQVALVEAGARPAEDPGRTDAILRLIRQWAAAEPAAAAGWALRQTDIPADLALAAVFDALAARPDLAVEFALTFAQQHPERADDIGRYLIAALGRAGAYEHAAAFAASGEGNGAVDWITAAYFNWGRNDPQRALRTVEAMGSADLRQTAFQALVSGWAKTDPVRLLENYPAFPPGWDQRFAVVTGLRAWIELDPEAAAEWVKRARLPFDPDWELVLAD